MGKIKQAEKKAGESKLVTKEFWDSWFDDYDVTDDFMLERSDVVEDGRVLL